MKTVYPPTKTVCGGIIMVGNRTPNTAKIRGYILNWMKLGLGAWDIYNEICGA